jgi:hypothetical protein
MAQVHHPSNLIDRVIALERELAEVRKKVGLSSATISSGGLTIEGGFLKLIDPEGQWPFYIGPLTPNRPDASPQQAWVVRDDNGTARIFVWDDDPGGLGGYRQMVAINDSSNNRVFQDDKVTGAGLARPWIPLRTMRTRFLDWPKCAIGSWETMHEIRMPKQQPKIRVSIVSASEAGTTGQIRVMVDGVQQFIRTVSPGTIFVDNVDVDNPASYLAESSLNVDAIRTIGAGNVGVEIRYAFGWGVVT